MNRSHWIIFLSLLSVPLHAQICNHLDMFYDSLNHPVLDNNAAQISGIVLFRGGQEIGFTRGQLRLLRPVNGRTYGAVFTGDGYLTFAPPTHNEDKFKAIMSDFYNTYRDSDASTSDFRRIIEKHVGGDMRWFFNQWIYGTEIPTLKCTKTVTKTPDGKFTLVIGVEQTNVSKPFIIVLPLELEYGDGTKSAARLTIDAMKKEFSYTLDREPSAVKFDMMESLLCPIEE